MAKDRKYTRAKNQITGGHVDAFRDIFEDLPKTTVATDMGMNNTRFTRLMNNVELYRFEEAFRMAELIEIDKRVLIELIVKQYEVDKRSKSPKKS